MSFAIRRARRAMAIAAILAVAMGLLWADLGGTAVTQIRAGDNYPIRTDPNVARGKDAPGLAPKPGDPNRIVEVQLDLNLQECQYNVSTDGGGNWRGGTLVAPPPYPQVNACSTVGHGADAMDQGVAWGTGDVVYIPWASAVNDQSGTSVLLSKSTDGGLTFPPATVVIPGITGPAHPDFAFPKIAVRPGKGTNGADQIAISAEVPTGSGHELAGDFVMTVSNDSGV